ncbi:2'-5' RNA ligase family protein [Phenylobacterium sp.]|uniref:2'-5' RNA ligase family protein n=1 Tax=Phenylobacterium sp. TaxID=1871053 RepID=UPI0027306FBE|nr:2'-5' RNA ligase family protein [Phenylobacterium sp.]MDP2214332.1 2'-5' RNA ligase family protein [Phenylobacterium sp.]
MTEPPPLIITAALDEGAFDWFDDLRQAHFPQNRNLVPAHLTLFHALPGDHEPRIAEILKTACAARTPMRLAVRGPWFIGRGVAYRIASPELEALRADLAQAFAPWLTPQDRAPFRRTSPSRTRPTRLRRGRCANGCSWSSSPSTSPPRGCWSGATSAGRGRRWRGWGLVARGEASARASRLASRVWETFHRRLCLRPPIQASSDRGRL